MRRHNNGLESPPILTGEDCKRFSEFYDGHLSIIDSSTLDPSVNERFENMSRRFILPESYKPGDFHQYFSITHVGSPNEKTLVAHQTKVCDPRDLSGAERLIYLVDNLWGERVGVGEIRFRFDPNIISFRSNHHLSFFKDKPFVGYTGTERQYQRQGYGTRRLAVMNALVKTLFDLSLHSDTFPEGHYKESEGPWKKHLLNGAAIRHEHGQVGHRYSFK